MGVVWGLGGGSRCPPPPALGASAQATSLGPLPMQGGPSPLWTEETGDPVGTRQVVLLILHACPPSGSRLLPHDHDHNLLGFMGQLSIRVAGSHA